jgi:hypothetical protein
MKTIAEKGGLKLVLVTNYGQTGYKILDSAGMDVLGYCYQGSEKSAVRIFERKCRVLGPDPVRLIDSGVFGEIVSSIVANAARDSKQAKAK